MQAQFDKSDWRTIANRIAKGNCTPFLGAGACAGALPLGGEIARKWAVEYGYPMSDTHDLARVAQFVAVKKRDALFPKDEMQSELEKHCRESADVPEIHRFLAELPLPVYVTTNYDHFMAQALTAAGKRPRERVCAWNKHIESSLTEETKHFVEDAIDAQPTPDEPLVFHLHGIIDIPASMVLTEDDYLQFLINISWQDELLPLPVKYALTGTSLLFLGYAIADINFRVLFRSLSSWNLRGRHFSVQLPPRNESWDDEQCLAIQDYLHASFHGWDVRMFWGTCDDFLADLKSAWAQYSNQVPPLSFREGPGRRPSNLGPSDRWSAI
jgi:hypothetical protein